jgi:hypothetical protein
MQKSLFRGTVSLALALLLIFPRPLYAWGNVGHEAIAYVAWEQLTPAAKTRVMALLSLVPSIHNESGDIPGYAEWVTALPAGLTGDKKNQYLFMRAATWADSIKHHGLVDSDTPPPGVTTDVNIGFGDDHSHGYWHFVDAAFASDTEPVPATPIPNAATQIAALRNAIGSTEGDVLKAYDMIWLEHIVGDIHQPLHGAVRYNGGSGDVAGNLVKIKLPAGMPAKFVCPPSTTAPSELHAFWDDLPGSCPAATGLTTAAAFGKNLPLLLANGSSLVQVTDPQVWAAESLALAEKYAYAAPIGPGLRGAGGTAYTITPAYYTQALSDAKDRIALAGARLANMLNNDLK